MDCGQRIAHYTILRKLGQGGMGEVYLAHDTRLDRNVALKFLSLDLENDTTAHKRLLREAKSAAVLDHPFICHVHEIGEEDGKSFIAMEYVEGQTLKDRISLGPLPLQEALQEAAEVTEALKAAHQQQIVHRDLKPSNIMLTQDGHIKIMDFGLAKQLAAPEGNSEHETASETLTGTGTTLGTLPYMSPEQVRGQAVTCQSDIFSFGIMLYEMLTGVHPFMRKTALATAQAILTEVPPALSRYAKNLPKPLDRILKGMMAKEIEQRYETVSRVHADLEKVRFPQLQLKRNITIVALALLIMSATIFGFWSFQRASKARWAREQALPQIIHYVENGNTFAGFALAVEAEKYIPKDPLLLELWPRISTRYSVLTTPPGSDIFFKEYSNTKDEWQHPGRSPIQDMRLPIGAIRWKLTKEGYRTVETVRATPEAQTEDFTQTGKQLTMHITREIKVTLQKENAVPLLMLRIPFSAPSYFVQWLGLKSVTGPDFLIDQYEVTNREFKKFVDAGGYRNQKYWKQPIQIDKKPVSWEEAMNYFREKSGRLGPSTWEGGTYPQGQDAYPVSGVSWYEAAAYAEFAGKSLPTLYHWVTAARHLDDSAVIIPLSNFSGKGPAPVGSYPGIGLHELYDIAGNVAEWCWNAPTESEDLRYLLGGSWKDQALSFVNGDLRAPWDRSQENGFRTVIYPAAEGRVSEKLFDAVSPPVRKRPPSPAPVPDAEFEVYKRLYSYDRTPLIARLEATDDSSPLWRREKISFDAAYGNERMFAYLFLPKGVKPPYQTVVYFPGGLAGVLTSSEDVGKEQGRHDYFWEFLVLSGRALLYPIYKGTYERGPQPEFMFEAPLPEDKKIAYRDYQIQLFKDLGRSLDYLVTRNDINTEKLAYYGGSWGAKCGPINLALEKRLKAAVLILYVAESGLPAEVDPVNFAPHVEVPVLMINGQEDSAVDAYDPIEVFELFRTPKELKTLRTYPGGHSGMWGLFGAQLRKEILDWLNRYQGKVE